MQSSNTSQRKRTAYIDGLRKTDGGGFSEMMHYLDKISSVIRPTAFLSKHTNPIYVIQKDLGF